MKISKLREGLGVVTNNVAEYKALILGLKYALRKGFQNVVVNGDSKLVCMQVTFIFCYGFQGHFVFIYIFLRVGISLVK